MFEVRSLRVSVSGRIILDGLHMRVERGETVALFGPNGSGKTTLLRAVMGLGGYRIEAGDILLHGRSILNMSIDERARAGIGMLFQRPPAVRGVKLQEALTMAGGSEITAMAGRLNLNDMLGRDLNLGFSGGEIKRSELLQLMAQRPSFIMFDEPDSGVDLVSIGLVGRVMNELLEKDRKAEARTRAGLVISHGGFILDYVNPDRAYVLLRGRLYCSGNPRDLLDDIRAKGYEGCVTCIANCHQ